MPVRCASHLDNHGKSPRAKHSHTSNQQTKPLIAKDLRKNMHRDERCRPAPGRFTAWYRHRSRVFTICNANRDFLRIWLQNCYRAAPRSRAPTQPPWELRHRVFS